ncbi:MAG: hypothetical protein KatS3mg110_1666 [Pirellulaceae bacterium]|nr:MAG: hypothetical protein KatS3mg110_1666 [Pirellulaceae bacterium]
MGRQVSEGTLWPGDRQKFAALSYVFSPSSWLAAEPPEGTRIIQAHLGSTSAAYFTPDGQRLISAGADQMARLWRADDGALLREFTAHTGPIYCLAISGDGRWLATGAQDNTIRLWSLPLPGPASVQAVHEGGLATLARSQDGQLWISGGADRALRLWFAESQEPLPPRPGHPSGISAAAVRPDAMQLASGDQEGWVFLWHPYLEEPQARLAAHRGAVLGLSFLNDNQRWLSLGEDGCLRLWQQPPAGRIVSGLGPLAGLMTIVPNSAVAIVAGDDRKLRWVDLNQSQVIRQLDLPETATALTCSADAAHVAVGLESGRVLVVRQNDASLAGELQVHEAAVRELYFLADNQRLWSSGDDGRIQLCRLPMAPVSMEGHREAISGVAVAAGDAFWLSVSSDKTARLWNADGQPQRALPELASRLACASIRPDNSQVALGDVTGTISIVSLADGQVVQRFAAGEQSGQAVQHVTFSRDGQSLLSLCGDLVQHWRLVPAARPVAAHAAPVPVIATSGPWLLTGSADQKVRLSRWADGQTVRDFEGQLGPITAVAMAPNSQWAAAGGQSGKIRIWQTDNGQAWLEVSIEAAPVRDIAITDTRHLFAVDERAIYQWQIPDQPLPADAQVPTPAVGALPAGKPMSLAVAADASVAMVGSEDGSVWKWSAQSRQFEQLVPAGGKAVAHVAWKPSGDMLAASRADGSVELWKISGPGQPGQLRRTLRHGATAPAVAWAAQGPWLASQGDDGCVAVWHADEGALWERREVGSSTARCVAWCDANHLAASADNNVLVFERAVVSCWKIPSGTPAAWTAIEPYVVWADGQSATCHVYQWDGKPQEILQRPGAAVTLLESHAASGRLLVADDQGRIELWSLAERKPLARYQLSGKAASACWAANGTRLAIAVDNRVLLFNDQLDFLEAFHLSSDKPVRHLATSSDGQRVLVVIDNESAGKLLRAHRLAGVRQEPVRRWRLAGWGNYETLLAGGEAGKLLRLAAADVEHPQTISVPPSTPSAVAASTDGSRVFLVDDQNRAHLIQVSDQRELWNFQLDSSARQALWSNDNQRLAVVLESGEVWIVDPASGPGVGVPTGARGSCRSVGQ